MYGITSLGSEGLASTVDASCTEVCSASNRSPSKHVQLRVTPTPEGVSANKTSCLRRCCIYCTCACVWCARQHRPVVGSAHDLAALHPRRHQADLEPLVLATRRWSRRTVRRLPIARHTPCKWSRGCASECRRNGYRWGLRRYNGWCATDARTVPRTELRVCPTLLPTRVECGADLPHRLRWVVLCSGGEGGGVVQVPQLPWRGPQST